MKASIRIKLMGPIAIILIVVFIMIAIAYVELEHLGDIANHQVALFNEIALVSQLNENLQRLPRPVDHYLITGSSQGEKIFDEQVKALRSNLKRVDKLPIINPQERKLLKKIANQTEEAIKKLKVVFLTNPKTNPKVAFELMRQGDEKINQATKNMRKFRQIDQQEIIETSKEAKKANSTEQNLIIGLVLIALLASGFGVVVTYLIIRPIIRFHEGVELMSEGNLSSKLEIKTGDEIEDLAKAFDQMVQSLRQEEETAARIQQRLLPPKLPNLEGVKIHAQLLQSKIVGGDWYDYYKLDNNLYLTIADASGKGMPGALLSTVAMSTIRSEPKRTSNMLEVLKKTNKTVVNRLGGGDFVTLFSARLNLDTHTMSYINCGHEPPLIYRTVDQSWTLLECQSGLAIGISEKLFDPKMQEIKLQTGDRLLLYTDGLHDVRNPKGELFNLKLIVKWLDDHKELPLEKLINNLTKAATNFSGLRQPRDDITILAIEIT
jgi:serine phosphatase RsbU (regulator of sigma subunit)/CHASE3 domain sensor protein